MITGHPLTRHICAKQFVHKCGTHIAWLEGQHGSSHHGLQCHLCAPEKNLVIWCHMFHPWLSSHLPFTTSTSSSSFTLPSATQEHAARSVQQEQLREHSVHAAHLQAPSVDKLRHQESLWREDLKAQFRQRVGIMLPDLENNSDRVLSMRLPQTEALMNTSLNSRRSARIPCTPDVGACRCETRSIGKISACMEQHTDSSSLICRVLR